MPNFAIFLTSNGYDDFEWIECEDFHSAAENALSFANTAGSRLREIDILIEIPTHDGTPQIGIFWCVQSTDGEETLLVDCVSMSNAEIYGEFLTHGSHYEYWSKLAMMSRLQLEQSFIPDVVRWTEYENWPRGRVVLHQPTGRFTLYADKKLRTSTMIQNIMERFSLKAEHTDVRGDPHYIVTR